MQEQEQSQTFDKISNIIKCDKNDLCEWLESDPLAIRNFRF